MKNILGSGSSLVAICLFICLFVLINPKDYNIEYKNVFEEICINNSECYELTLYPVEEIVKAKDAVRNISGEFSYFVEYTYDGANYLVEKGTSRIPKKITLMKGYPYFFWAYNKDHYSTKMLDQRNDGTFYSYIELPMKVGKLGYDLSSDKLEENKSIKLQLKALGKVNYLGMCIKTENILNLSINHGLTYSMEKPEVYEDYDECKNLLLSLNNDSSTIEFIPRKLLENLKLDIVIFDMQRMFYEKNNNLFLGIQAFERKKFLGFNYYKDIGVKNIKIKIRGSN